VLAEIAGAFEQILEIVIIVVIETSHADALPVAKQLSSDIAVLTAVVSFNCESAVGPQLSLGTETVWRLQQRYQQSSPHRTDERNLAQ